MAAVEPAEIQSDPVLPLGRLFNDQNTKVLDILLINEDLGYTQEEIAKLTKLPTDLLSKSLQFLLDDGIINYDKIKANTYSANLRSPKTIALLEYIRAALRANFERALKN